jgi:hypothetical protein
MLFCGTSNFSLQAHIYLVPSGLFIFVLLYTYNMLYCGWHCPCCTEAMLQYNITLPKVLISISSQTLFKLRLSVGISLTVSASMFSSFSNSEQSIDYHFSPFESHLTFESVLGLAEMADCHI